MSAEVEADEDARLGIYRAFAQAGRSASTRELAVAVGRDDQSVRASIRRLAEARHLALDDDGEIVLAHPFATRNIGFSVMGATRLWWGGCAWDSFAIPHLVPDEPNVLVATRCPNCEKPLAWNVNRHEPPAGPEVAHFLVPMHAVWDDVVHACSHQQIFCSPAEALPQGTDAPLARRPSLSPRYAPGP
ncbi:organomercurial lyase [Micromonospora sp. 4G57]|uniref:Organomercurial lyase n=1 Tax=Micromonospora sicca TaxID=2202420 RepID=A0ABU5J7E0_9ACTN|nr:MULTISPECIES: organomercurial lyase [unclassified Micromonospora]MDZ5444731.1 organomercurial lyase [Micromonospora sp. 4G57]MDZ5488468.1 organomercurial lyase [Micromonospora sp. 4G53]